MISVGVNPPKTPVTEGSNDVAPASVPNVCKMPGPPAPFVPTPLPNVGMSGDNLADCTTTVKIEGKKVAIKGSYYMSKGDIASKGTGGGIVSATTHGKTEFVAPGSMDVKFQGKNVQLLGDAMTNNGNMANAATPPGNLQPAATPADMRTWLGQVAKYCHEKVEGKKGAGKKSCKSKGTAKHKCCENMIKAQKNPSLRSEVPFRKSGQEVSSRVEKAARRAAKKAYDAAKAGGGPTKGVYMTEFFKASRIYCKADALIGAKPGPYAPFDFKFNCSGEAKMDKKQRDKYDHLMKKGVFSKAVELIGPSKW